MLLLEAGNKSLADAISAQLATPEPDQHRVPIDAQLNDYDDARYHIQSGENDTLLVSLSLPSWQEVQNKGGLQAVQNAYGPLVTNTEDGYDVTLKIDLNNPQLPREEIASKVSQLKTVAHGGAFDLYFSSLLSGQPQTQNYSFHLGPDTPVYLFPRNDRVIIVYSLTFADKVDTAIAKVFLQEFVDARKRMSAAPPCTFSVNPPLEMAELGVTQPTGNLGFVSFAVMKSHVDAGRKDKVSLMLLQFRNYLSYHIKCSKAHFHSRMRARVVNLLKILNRAKQELPTEKKEMRTIQGKTFTRQV